MRKNTFGEFIVNYQGQDYEADPVSDPTKVELVAIQDKFGFAPLQNPKIVNRVELSRLHTNENGYTQAANGSLLSTPVA